MDGDGEISFGECLRRLRVGAGLTQEALAERAGLSVDAIASLERGRRRAPRPDTLRRLVQAIGARGADRAALVRAATVACVPAAGEFDAALPGRLPIPAGELIGREAELTAVIELLRGGGCRLVTLTGAGGAGKTRLAIAAAAALEAGHGGGAAFVSLAGLRDPRAVLPAVARALGVRSAGRAPVTERLRAQLASAGRELILVLDTFEHVLPAAPQLAGLLAACPGLTVIVTSRVALRLRAEQRFVVPPLAVPSPADLAAGALAGGPAVELFLVRARAVSRAFSVRGAAELRAAAEICRRLDGLPLLIELAAARAAVLGPAHLAARLAVSLDALGEGARDLPDRQRSLRASFDWTYALLPAQARTLLARLAVRGDGGPAESIEAACGPGCLDALELLVDFSLVQVSDGAGGRRFRLLGTTYECARGDLRAAG